MRKPQLKITRRTLPHWEFDGSVYFITFNTWKRFRLTPSARQLVFDACRFFDRQRYELFTLVVMPDHMHMLIQPLPKSEQEYWTLSSILHSIKSYSAKQIPKAMARTGSVWQSESYDRIIRSEIKEPAKAGLSFESWATSPKLGGKSSNLSWGG